MNKKKLSRPIFFFLFLIINLLFFISCQNGSPHVFAQQNMRAERLGFKRTFDVETYQKLEPLFELKKAPGPGDWLASFPEPGQTYDDYLKIQPTIPDHKRKYIDITLIGDFDKQKRDIIQATADYIEIFYGLPVRVTQTIPLSDIPHNARREYPVTGDKQLLTTYVIEKILVPRLAKDAFCLIAFTASDLWPGAGWNFVFGQASLEDRVGVWSIYRNGDPSQSPEDYQLCLKRTIKTGVHEIGHMFSMHHCIYYECLMNGSNHRKESDEQPLWLCPVCLRKLNWANPHFENQKRYEKLIKITEKYYFHEESSFYKKCLEILNNIEEKISP